MQLQDFDGAGGAGEGAVGEDGSAFFGSMGSSGEGAAFDEGDDQGRGAGVGLCVEDFDLDAGPGAHAADSCGDGGGVLGEVDPGFFAGKFGGAGGERGVLREAVEGVGLEGVEDLGEERCAEGGEAVVEFAGGFGVGDGGGGGGEDVAGVHDGGDLDDADAGEGIVVDDGPVDGGGAAVFGEEGGVEVDAAVGGGGEEGVGKFLAEGDDDEAVGGEVAEEGEDFGGVGVGGAGEGEVVVEGPLGDGGGGEGFARGRRGGRARRGCGGGCGRRQPTRRARGDRRRRSRGRRFAWSECKRGRGGWHGVGEGAG